MNKKATMANLLLLFWIMGFISACGNGISNGPPSPATRESNDRSVIMVHQLAKEFGENEIAADQLYRDRRITLAGTVDSVEKYGDRTALTFAGNLPQAVCYFTDSDELAELRHDDEVTVEATVLGFEDANSITLVLDDCSLR